MANLGISAYRKLPAPRPEGAPPLLRLNLGCGHRRLGGFINIDENASLKPDIVRDLRRGLPFSDGVAAEIRAFDFLEHLPTPEDLIFVVNECWRVLDAGGTAVFRTPNWLSKEHPEWAIGDPTHRRAFTEHTWDYFRADHEQYEFNGRAYGIRPWRINIQMLSEGAVIQAMCEPVKTASEEAERG